MNIEVGLVWLDDLNAIFNNSFGFILIENLIENALLIANNLNEYSINIITYTNDLNQLINNLKALTNTDYVIFFILYNSTLKHR